MADEKVIIRFLLDLQAEDTSYVDVEFNDERQAKRAVNALLAGQGQLVSVQNASSIPVLLRADDVSAAFPIEYDDDDDEEEED